MKKINLRNSLLASSLFSVLLLGSCKENTSTETEEVASEETAQTETSTSEESKESELDFIFPKGDKGPEKNFTGNAFNAGLVAPDSTYTTAVGNVYFEPGGRSNWHTHPDGQILIITDGKGYH